MKRIGEGADRVSANEVLKSREAEQAPRLKTFLTSDRHDWTAVTRMEIDPRAQSIDVAYRSEFPERYDGSSPMVDDHYRGINKHLKVGRGYGGRDDRHFSLKHSDAYAKKFEELQSFLADSDKRADVLRQELLVRGMFFPEKIEAVREVKSETLTEENGDGSAVDVIYEFLYLDWVLKASLGRGTLVVDSLLAEGSDREKIENKFEEMKANGPSKNALAGFEKLKEDYINAAEECGLTSLLKEIDDAKKELKPYNNSDNVDANIVLFSPESDEGGMLLSILKSGKSRMIDGAEFDFDDAKLIAELRAEDEGVERAQGEGDARKTELDNLYAQNQLDYDRRQRDAAKLVEDRRVAEIEAELTYEIREEIEGKILELNAAISILRKIPASGSDVEAFIKSLPAGALNAASSNYESRAIGIESLAALKKIGSKIDQLSKRKKINESFRGLRERMNEILEIWKSIGSKIDAHEEAEMILEDRLISKEELTVRVSKAFLEDPWNASLESVIDDIANAVLEEGVD
jgi:hypothetical protein